MRTFKALKQKAGKSIIVGSSGLIVTLMQPDLIDAYPLCVQPIILGRGLTLFKNVSDRIDLRLIKTKILGSGSLVLYYEPKKSYRQRETTQEPKKSDTIFIHA